MNKQSQRARQLSKVSKKMLIEYFTMITGYTALTILFVFLAQLFCRRFIWYWEDPLYQLLACVKEYLLFFLVAVLLLGWFFITYRFITKLLRYLDEVAAAAEALASPSSEPIVLSDAMAYTENDLNRVRERALNNARAAEKAEQRKNDLVVYLAHDLKTPLTSVIGYLSLLHDEPELAPSLREKYLGIALSKAERLEELINEFFEITRFNLSHITLSCSRVNLTRLLEQLTYEFRPMLGEKDLSCELSIPPDTELRCDVDKIQRVFDNLLRNAVNYAHFGSAIHIRCAPCGKDLRITFQNSGDPIPKEKLDRIFEQFYRLDTARGSASGGAGLGLAIAREIVEHHGGTISARSEGETITFEVVLPVEGPASSENR